MGLPLGDALALPLTLLLDLIAVEQIKREGAKLADPDAEAREVLRTLAYE